MINEKYIQTKIITPTYSCPLIALSCFQQYENAIGDLKKNSSRPLVLVQVSDDETFPALLVHLINQKIPFLLSRTGATVQELNELIRVYAINYLFAKKDLGIGKVIFEHGNCALYFLSKPNFNIHADLAMLLTTSGSTAAPKLVKISYSNLKISIAQISNLLKLSSDDTAIITLPGNYSYGLSIYLTHLFNGASLAFPSKSVIEKDFWRFANSIDNLNLSAVPFQYQMMLNLYPNSLNFHNFRFITQAGGRLNIHTCQKILELVARGITKFYVMYGQTEATSRISGYCVNDNQKKISSVGKSVIGGKLKIDKENLNDDSGEILYEGENIFHGYAKEANDLTDLQHIKILHTGDVGYIDNDGYLYITGRKSRFAKINGIRFNLQELEEQLDAKHQVVIDVEEGNDSSLVSIVATVEITKDKLQQFSQKIRIPLKNIRLLLVEDMPRTVNNKVDYKVLKDLCKKSIP